MARAACRLSCGGRFARYMRNLVFRDMQSIDNYFCSFPAFPTANRRKILVINFLSYRHRKLFDHPFQKRHQTKRETAIKELFCLTHDRGSIQIMNNLWLETKANMSMYDNYEGKHSTGALFAFNCYWEIGRLTSERHRNKTRSRTLLNKYRVARMIEFAFFYTRSKWKRTK